MVEDKKVHLFLMELNDDNFLCQTWSSACSWPAYPLRYHIQYQPIRMKSYENYDRTISRTKSMLALLTLEYKTQDGRWIVFLSNFQKQSVRLILLAILDLTVGKNAEIMNTRIFFYVENLEPNQGKKPRPTTRRISTLHYHGQICYKVTHLVTT